MSPSTTTAAKELDFDVLSPSCPSRVVLQRIGDRWTIFIILALSTETLRFTELKRRIGGVTPKVLTETLRSLEADGLIARQVFAEAPPRVEYHLTELGRSLLGPLTTVREWAEVNVPAVLASRERAEELLDH